MTEKASLSTSARREHISVKSSSQQVNELIIQYYFTFFFVYNFIYLRIPSVRGFGSMFICRCRYCSFKLLFLSMVIDSHKPAFNPLFLIQRSIRQIYIHLCQLGICQCGVSRHLAKVLKTKSYTTLYKSNAKLLTTHLPIRYIYTSVNQALYTLEN